MIILYYRSANRYAPNCETLESCMHALQSEFVLRASAIYAQRVNCACTALLLTPLVYNYWRLTMCALSRHNKDCPFVVF